MGRPRKVHTFGSVEGIVITDSWDEGTRVTVTYLDDESVEREVVFNIGSEQVGCISIAVRNYLRRRAAALRNLITSAEEKVL